VLLDALALQHRVEVNQSNHREGDNGCDDAQDVFVLLEKGIFHG
jgi:hypothetical protein